MPVEQKQACKGGAATTRHLLPFERTAAEEHRRSQQEHSDHNGTTKGLPQEDDQVLTRGYPASLLLYFRTTVGQWHPRFFSF